MIKLKKYKLEYELTYQYFFHSLKGINELSTQLISSLDFKRGNFFTVLNDNLNLQWLYEFKCGGIANGVRPYVKNLLFNKINSSNELSVVFDDFNSDYYKECNVPLFLDCGMHYKNQVYYLIVKDTVSREKLEDCFYASNAVWHSLCILSEIRFNPIEHRISQEQIRDVCLNTQIIILGAYDAEGYVFWESKNNSRPLITEKMLEINFLGEINDR